MQPGDQHPQHTQQAKNQKRVVEPEPAVRIDNHWNECSAERVFGCKRRWRHKLVTPVLLAPLLLLLTGCAPDPARLQSTGLLDQLIQARTMFGAPSPRVTDACNIVGEVQNRLYGEPGLSDVQPAWSALLAGAQALQAVCGQSTLLEQPANDSQVLLQARQARERGIQREMGVACDHLRFAAAALGHPAPC